MLNWKSIDTVILYDGTFQGLLTIVFDCYLSKKIPLKIIPEQEYLSNILDKTVYVETDFAKSDRIFHGISKNICNRALYDSYYAFLSANSNKICQNKEIEILKFILHGFIIGPKIITMLSIDYVLSVMKLRKNVLGEAHRLKGLTRLQEIGNNLFYASIHPENNVIENLGQFFIRRFPTQNLILHDKNRELAFLYNTKEYTIIDVSNQFINPTITESEKQFQSLWKTFFKTIAIKERTNKRCQMQYMPKKYWKDLIEMQPDFSV